MPSCSAINCTNKSGRKSGHTFHRYPRLNSILLKQWVAATRRDDWAPSATSVLCSDHFEDQCLVNTGKVVRVKKGSIPTIFNFARHRTKNFMQSLKVLRKSPKKVMPPVGNLETSTQKVKPPVGNLEPTLQQVMSPVGNLETYLQRVIPPVGHLQTSPHNLMFPVVFLRTFPQKVVSPVPVLLETIPKNEMSGVENLEKSPQMVVHMEIIPKKEIPEEGYLEEQQPIFSSSVSAPIERNQSPLDLKSFVNDHRYHANPNTAFKHKADADSLKMSLIKQKLKLSQQNVRRLRHRVASLNEVVDMLKEKLHVANNSTDMLKKYINSKLFNKFPSISKILDAPNMVKKRRKTCASFKCVTIIPE